MPTVASLGFAMIPAGGLPRPDWTLDFFRAGTRSDVDARVVAIAPAEVRGAAFYGLIRARA